MPGWGSPARAASPATRSPVPVQPAVNAYSATLILVALAADVRQKLNDPDPAVALKFAVVRLCIERKRQPDLLEIVPAYHAFRLVAGLIQGRH